MVSIDFVYLYCCEQKRGTYKGPLEAAVKEATAALGAVQLASGAYAYVASETGLTYVLTESEIAELGAALIKQPLGDCYSIWCASNGREATKREEAEAEALRDSA
jgi:hypothetical protein